MLRQSFTKVARPAVRLSNARVAFSTSAIRMAEGDLGSTPKTGGGSVNARRRTTPSASVRRKSFSSSRRSSPSSKLT
ncbi:ATPase inhibitor, variant 2 [Pyricularia oryzae]